MCPRSRSLPPLPLLSHSLTTPTFSPLRPEEGTHPLTTFLEDGNHFYFTSRFFRRGQKLRGTVSSISSGVIVLVRNSAHAHYPLFFREDLLSHECCCSLTEFQPVKYPRSFDGGRGSLDISVVYAFLSDLVWMQERSPANYECKVERLIVVVLIRIFI